MTQVTVKQLEIGKVYKITHQRKGRFVAVLLDVVENENDEIDEVFLHVRFDTRAGTDQVRLSIEPGKANVRESRLRPSLISKIEIYEEDTWMRNVKLPEPLTPPKKKTILQRLKGE